MCGPAKLSRRDFLASASRLGAALAVADLLPLPVLGKGRVYPDRWVYVASNLDDDNDVAAIRDIARTAAEHGLNGMVLNAGLDKIDLQPASYLRRLEEVNKICSQEALEIIPCIFSVGYGNSLLAHNPNLAEGLPVTDALFVASNGEARLRPDPPVEFVNGSFEEYQGNLARGYSFQDQPGTATFIDTRVFHSGAASLRFENPRDQSGSFRHLTQEIAVRPHRCYRLTAWVRTEDLSPGGSLLVQVLGPDERLLGYWVLPVSSTTDWIKVTRGFNSGDNKSVRVDAGAEGGKGGKCWLDDLRVEEAGLVNVLRRPGTPITVRSEKTGRLYEEGRDFAPIADPMLSFRFDHDGPAIRLLPKSRVAEGERLRVSYYHGQIIAKEQVVVCMSEPEVYAIWQKQAQLFHQYLAPAKYFLDLDEIRGGGTCRACLRRRMSMAQILGDCITKQFDILRGLNPAAQVFAWSDMLDPNHNAHGNYYVVEGDYTGSWKYVPKELGIVCWYYEKRQQSLAHFSGLGFRTVAGAYYDTEALDNPRGWLGTLDTTLGAIGIMYTTWRDDYRLLGPFGDLVSKPR